MGTNNLLGGGRALIAVFMLGCLQPAHNEMYCSISFGERFQVAAIAR
jgi:hypothetical protein